MVTMELFGEPWVMFRDAQGLTACVKDACAHRACPLSLVSPAYRPVWLRWGKCMDRMPGNSIFVHLL